MTVRTKDELKGFFNYGDVPSESNMHDLIDSVPTIEEVLEAVSTGDCDTVDGKDASDFADKVHGHSGSDINGAVATATDASTLEGYHASDFALAAHEQSGDSITSPVQDANSIGGWTQDQFAKLSYANNFDHTQTIAPDGDVPALEIFANPDQNDNLINVYDPDGVLQMFADWTGWCMSYLNLKRAGSTDVMHVTDAANNLLMAIKQSGAIELATMADTVAENGTIYYSTTQQKVVFKDSSGVVINFGQGSIDGLATLLSNIFVGDQQITGKLGIGQAPTKVFQVANPNFGYMTYIKPLSENISNSGLLNFNATNIFNSEFVSHAWRTSDGSSNSAVNSCVVFDFLTPVTPQSFSLFISDAGYDGTYTLYYSSDGTNWTTTNKTITPSLAGWNCTTPLTTLHTARYWQLRLTTGSTTTMYINEMQIIAATGGVTFQIDETTGRIGVNEPTPDRLFVLTTHHPGYNSSQSPLQLNVKMYQPPSDGAGGEIPFSLEYPAGTKNLIGVLRVVRDGSNTSGCFELVTYADGTPSTWFRLLSNGEMRFGGPSNYCATRANGTIQLVHLADTSAANDAVYFSTTQNKVVYKSSGGVITPLYVDAASVVSYAKVVDQKASGTAGGNLTGGSYTTRVLNTIETDEIGVSLSSNKILLPAGKYRIYASVPAHMVNKHRIKIVNADAATTILYGTSAFAYSTSAVDNNSFARGQFTLAQSTNIRVDHYVQTARTSGDDAGVALSITNEPEIYTVVELWKVG